MDQASIIAELETRADKVGVPIYTICENAGVAPSTFYRWKGGSGATLTKIAAIQKELGRLEAERAS